MFSSILIMQDCVFSSVAFPRSCSPRQILLTCTGVASWSSCTRIIAILCRIYYSSCTRKCILKSDFLVVVTHSENTSFSCAVGAFSCCHGNSVACCFRNSPLCLSRKQLWYRQVPFLDNKCLILLESTFFFPPS